MEQCRRRQSAVCTLVRFQSSKRSSSRVQCCSENNEMQSIEAIEKVESVATVGEITRRVIVSVDLA